MPAADRFRRWVAPGRAVLGRLLRFGLVGGLATLVHAGVSLLAHSLLGQAPLVANFSGFCVAFVVSFCGHALFTFGSGVSVARAVRFTSVALAGIGLSTGLVLAAQTWTSLRPEIYLPIVAVCVPAFNFTCHSLWTFRRARGMVG